jgi:hypothetical protein
MLTWEPRSWQGPGLQWLLEKILALKSGSLRPHTGCQNKQGHLIMGHQGPEWAQVTMPVMDLAIGRFSAQQVMRF